MHAHLEGDNIGRLFLARKETVGKWITDMLADSTVTQICARAIEHYIMIAKHAKMDVVESRLISGFIPEKTETYFQYLRVLNSLVSLRMPR